MEIVKNIIEKTVNDIINGFSVFNAEIVESYYMDSYAKLILPNKEITVHIDNNYIHGSISSDDFKISNFITLNDHQQNINITIGCPMELCIKVYNIAKSKCKKITY